MSSACCTGPRDLVVCLLPKAASVPTVTSGRPVMIERWRTAVRLLAMQLCASAVVVLAEAFRNGDIVHMSHRSKGAEREKRETPWEEALRSQMPHFGRPGTVRFEPLPPDGAPQSPEEDGLAVAFAFSQEQFVLRPVAIQEGRRGGGGNSGGAFLKRLVVTFACAAGDIVTVRSDPVYGDTSATTSTDEPPSFDIEYRWDRLPEEDAQTGVWVVFVASLVLTVVLALDACDGIAEDDRHRSHDTDDDDRAVTSSSSSPSPSSGFRDGAGREGVEMRRIGGGGEVRRRR